MITQSEKRATLLSPTKKDYYQIWNQLLQTASKISDRWDPSSTNESDPGIVLLKLLTAIADKLNYNIDKNTLEAFMPSASQEQSMRKLCQMMGYDIGYYRSATTNATITYLGDWKATDNTPITQFYIPLFTNITNADNSINYFTIQQTALATISKSQPSVSVKVMQGQLVECQPDNNYLITLQNLDDNYRYYFPQTQIAENGIFVLGGSAPSFWDKVNNLYTRDPNSCVYKFGFDSKKGLPYIEFPQTISQLIGSGLKIAYTRTQGVLGNVSANQLTKLVAAKGSLTDSSGTLKLNFNAQNDFKITNIAAATQGADKESIDQAYRSYKKTVGTFDTLVTCRDYMNAIYKMQVSDQDVTPIVSNVKVADIRDDINKAITLCTLSQHGLKIKQMARQDASEKIKAFQLVLYPYTYRHIPNNPNITRKTYNDTFTYDNDATTQNRIEYQLQDYKTLAHQFITPYVAKNSSEDSDIVLIKNYYRLQANITTTKKVSAVQEEQILNNIYLQLYKKFNMRELDFGQQIDFDDILSTIENADTRIRNAALFEPTLVTAFVTADGKEYTNISSDAEKTKTYNELYNKLALRNVLAGRLALLNFDDAIIASWDQNTLSTTTYPSYQAQYSNVTKIESEFVLDTNEVENYTLGPNEVIQFSGPNFRTSLTYPAYVNYYFYKPESPQTEQENKAATFESIGAFFKRITTRTTTSGVTSVAWKTAPITYSTGVTITLPTNGGNPPPAWKGDAETGDWDWDAFYGHQDTACPCGKDTGASVFKYDGFEGWMAIVKFIQACEITYGDNVTKQPWSKLYEQTSASLDYEPGFLVDAQQQKYLARNKQIVLADPWNDWYVQEVSQLAENDFGNGKAAIAPPIASKNSQYKLQEGQLLLINYTPSSTGQNSQQTTQPPVYQVYGAGTRIRANFDLYASNGKTGSKTFDGLKLATVFSSGETKFVNCAASDVSNNAHLGSVTSTLTLGANQQIELREESSVKIANTDETVKNFYFYYQGAQTNAEGGYTLAFENGSYTLKDGQYFFYTGANKTDMAYYGAGTIIEAIGFEATEIPLHFTKGDIAAIFEDGISQIPWLTIGLTNTKYFNIKQQQYITLSQGDTIKYLKTANSDSINNNLADVYGTPVYTTAGSTQSTYLADLGADASWKVRSRLDITLSSATRMQLNTTNISEDVLTITYNTITNNDGTSVTTTNTAELKSVNGATPLCVKADRIVYSTNSSVALQNATIKLVQYQQVVKSDVQGGKTAIPLNNLLNNWTKVTLAPGQSFRLYSAFDSGTQFGVFSVYMQQGQLNQITITNTSVFDGSVSSNKANTYKIATPGAITITNPAAEATNVTIVLSNIDIVNTNWLNPAIDWRLIDTDAIDPDAADPVKAANDAKQQEILTAIRNALNGSNQVFYYNVRPEKDFEIDLQKDDTLATQHIWYDYNNINNNFVISQIDTNWLFQNRKKNKGITLTNSSKY